MLREIHAGLTAHPPRVCHSVSEGHALQTNNMESFQSIMDAYEFVEAHERKQAYLQSMRDTVQRALQSGVTHLDNPARISYYYSENQFNDDSVSVSAEHYALIRDTLSDELRMAQQVDTSSDGPAFPKKYAPKLIEALESQKIAWKRWDNYRKRAWGTPYALSIPY